MNSNIHDGVHAHRHKAEKSDRQYPSKCRHCCDLLSNSYLCSSCDSVNLAVKVPQIVVICFQILTFAVAATVFHFHLSYIFVL